MASIDVVVVFRFNGIADPDSVSADSAVENLMIDLEESGIYCDEWYIDDVSDSEQ